MPWVRLDDGFAEHPKVLSVSVQARWAYISALCYSNRRQTDGVIPRTSLSILGVSPKQADELVKARLWDAQGNDFMIHDFLEYNLTKEQITERATRRSAAGAVGGSASGAKRRTKVEANRSEIVGESLPERSYIVEAKTNPNPNPNPNPTHLKVCPDDEANASDTHTENPEIPVAIREMRDTILSCLPANYRWDSASMGEAEQLARDFEGEPKLITDAISKLRSRGERVWPNAIRKEIAPPKPPPVKFPTSPPLDMRYAPDWHKEMNK